MSVITSPQVRISINSPQRETIRTVGVGASGGGASSLVNLLDVDATSSDNGEVLVYDSTAQKYVIKVLPAIDGGTF